MRFEILQPSTHLANIVKYYWVIEKTTFEPDVCERVIPTGCLQFMFHYQTPFVVFKDGESITNQPRSLVSGLAQTYTDVAAVDCSGVIAVTFHPWGACQILPFSLDELEDSSIQLYDVFGKEISKLENQLTKATCSLQRVRAIESFLTSHLISIKPQNASFVSQSLTHILKAQGMLTMLELENRLGMSGRNLERKFAAFVGKTPKQYAKIVRFQSVVKELSKNKPIEWAQLAYAFGFADQSHLIKEFKSISGLTPVSYKTLCCNNSLRADSTDY